MTRKYGFAEDAPDDAAVPPLRLPEQKTRAERPSEDDVAAVVRTGRELGFVSREPAAVSTPTQTGRRKKTEPQDKMMIAGPTRVLKAFRDYCDAEGHRSYWAGIESIMKKAGLFK